MILSQLSRGRGGGTGNVLENKASSRMLPMRRSTLSCHSDKETDALRVISCGNFKWQ